MLTTKLQQGIYLGVSQRVGGLDRIELAAFRVPRSDGISHVSFIALQVPVFKHHQILSASLPVTETWMLQEIDVILVTWLLGYLVTWLLGYSVLADNLENHVSIFHVLFRNKRPDRFK